MLFDTLVDYILPSPHDPYIRLIVPRYVDFSALVPILKKISNDANLRADFKKLLILLLLFGENKKNSVVRYNMIKICLLKNKIIPNENHADSRKSIYHNVTIYYNATTQKQKKTKKKKEGLPEDIRDIRSST